MNEFLHILKHSAIDSLKVFIFAFIIYIILSFFENKITNLLKKNKKIDPILGSLAGLIPQCGVSIVASDLYLKKHITMGTLIAVFFACSDEALPILLSDTSKIIYLLPLLIIKFIVGFSLGFIVDLIIDKKEVEKHLDSNCDGHEIEDNHIGCCAHSIDHEENKIKEHLIHPLLHSIKIFAYVFIVNILFGLLIHLIGGEEVILSFLSNNIYLSPLFSTIVGLIPNCASSVLISELFLMNGIPFASLVSGLSVNSGLGLVYLIKNKKNWKNILIIVSILFLTSLILGYILLGISLLF